jgi:selenocysteine lyase/cysteine desulfurase
MHEDFGPFVGNTHSESSATGTAMTLAYHEAHRIIKAEVNAGPDDVLLTCGSGMTGAVNKFQRILGLKAPQGLRKHIDLAERDRPVVFVTHMEHHSNHTSWYETIADVEVIPPDARGLPDLQAFAALLDVYKDRTFKVGSFSACSNVTGVQTPYRAMAKLIHQAGGVAFVDFAASAPYVAIDMHPADEEPLDAVFFSPHKYLGGPGAVGVLVFNRSLYRNSVPDDAGGGTVAWTNPWGQYAFVDDIEAREDGGTPGFLQTIRAALAMRVKGAMGVDAIAAREHAIVPKAMVGLRSVPGVHLLANELEERLAIFSFYVEDLHYNLMVRLLNDRYGIQARGGCSCAGTYGHYLLHVDPTRSKRITDKIDQGDLSDKPGWVRLSFHPTTPDAELEYCLDAVKEIVANKERWAQDYMYDPHTNEYRHRDGVERSMDRVRGWFQL